MTSDMVERAAQKIYESKLLVQPRGAWQGGKASVTEIFCMQAARAVVDIVIEDCAQIAESASIDAPDHKWSIDRIAHAIRSAPEDSSAVAKIERLAKG